MNNEVYCSIGAFIGRVNGVNYKLLLEYGDQIECDGFEILFFKSWQGRIHRIISEYRAAGIACPVVHADKSIGDLMSNHDFNSMKTCLDAWSKNCELAAELGARKIVAHIWGIPDSDKNIELIFERCGILMEIAEGYQLDMLTENCFCVNQSPLQHFRKLTKIYPDFGITLDTRPAQFHRELDDFMQSGLFESGNIRHIHVNDYKGGYKDWSAMYPIPQPGKGMIDFETFFSFLKQCGYQHTLTLEAPSMLPDRVDVETLNQSLRYIRDHLQ